MGRQGFDLPLPMHHQQSAAITFCCRLMVVTGPAQALQITFRIGPPMSFRGDVVHCLCLCCATVTQALLAQMFVPAQHHSTQPVPPGTVAALVSALTLLVVLPACISVFFAVAAAVGGCLCAATFAAGPGMRGGIKILQ